ncbi:MAG: hypothetical protein J6K29_06750 [Clostridia bacterium]|nr:hypothetical protein [Clostridia bacterium]
MNAGAVEKLLHKIEDVKEALVRRKDAAAKEAFEGVRKAEQMFLDALAEKGMRFEWGKIIGANEDDDEVKKSNKKQSGEKSVRDTVDNEGGQAYNRNDDARDRAEYDSWRWTREHEIIDATEMDDFHTKLASTKFGDVFTRNKRGELIIPICPKTNKGHGINRKLAYVNGELEDFYISKVVVINYETETEIDEIRKDILKYEESGTGDAAKYVAHMAGEGFVTVYFRSDMQYNGQYSRRTGRYGSRENSEANNGNSQSGYSRRGYGKKNKPIKHITFDFEKEIEITYYKDGSKSIEPFRKTVKKSRKTVTATPPEVDHLTPMQKQTMANYTRAKVYTKAEALAVVEDMAHFLDETYGFDGGMGEASGFVTLTKTVKDGAARLFLLKTAKARKRKTIINDLSKINFRFRKIIFRNLLTNPPTWCIMVPMKQPPSETGTAATEELLWQPNPRSPSPPWSPTTPTARRSARPLRPP